MPKELRNHKDGVDSSLGLWIPWSLEFITLSLHKHKGVIKQPAGGCDMVKAVQTGNTIVKSMLNER